MTEQKADYGKDPAALTEAEREAFVNMLTLPGYDVDRILAAVEHVARKRLAEAFEAFAATLDWHRPAVSPCAPDFICCGSEGSCDAMRPSVSVVGALSVREYAATHFPPVQEDPDAT